LIVKFFLKVRMSKNGNKKAAPKSGRLFVNQMIGYTWNQHSPVKSAAYFLRRNAKPRIVSNPIIPGSGTKPVISTIVPFRVGFSGPVIPGLLL